MLKIGKKWYFKTKSTISEEMDECTSYNGYAKKEINCFKYRCLQKTEVEQLLNQTASKLSRKLHITPSLTKMLLRPDGWKVQSTIAKYRENSHNLPIENKIKSTAEIATATCSSSEETCSICLISLPKDNFDGLACSHMFCKECWRINIEMQVSEGNSFVMCMENNCQVGALEDFILKHLTVDNLRFRYHQYIFQNFVVCHPELRFCPGPDCTVIIQSKCWEPKCPIKCCECKTIFCFKCGKNYNDAPTNCKICKNWLSEAEIRGLIRDFPQCRCLIDKSNGWEIMKCSNCKFRFCWNSFFVWGNHDTTSKIDTNYSKNKNVTEEKPQNKKIFLSLREWYKNWEKHSKSLALVQEAYHKLTLRIKQKTGHECRIWMEWQDIYPILKLLTKCLNTLKYTYLTVCGMNAGLEKYLFQCRQKLLQGKLNKLTRKIEKAEVNDIAELQHQVMICEEYRKSLLIY